MESTLFSVNEKEMIDEEIKNIILNSDNAVAEFTNLIEKYAKNIRVLGYLENKVTNIKLPFNTNERTNLKAIIKKKRQEIKREDMRRREEEDPPLSPRLSDAGASSESTSPPPSPPPPGDPYRSRVGTRSNLLESREEVIDKRNALEEAKRQSHLGTHLGMGGKKSYKRKRSKRSKSKRRKTKKRKSKRRKSKRRN